MQMKHQIKERGKIKYSRRLETSNRPFSAYTQGSYTDHGKPGNHLFIFVWLS